jgi:hypothetical protein
VATAGWAAAPPTSTSSQTLLPLRQTRTPVSNVRLGAWNPLGLRGAASLRERRIREQHLFRTRVYDGDGLRFSRLCPVAKAARHPGQGFVRPGDLHHTSPPHHDGSLLASRSPPGALVDGRRTPASASVGSRPSQRLSCHPVLSPDADSPGRSNPDEGISTCRARHLTRALGRPGPSECR